MEKKQLVCPKCGSNKIREGAEYADKKGEGEKSARGGDEIIKHDCLVCGEQFSEE